MDKAARTAAVVPSSVNSRSGFCNETATFHSLRPPVTLPPLDQPFSVTSFSFSLLLSSFTPSSAPSGVFPDRPAYIDAATGTAISYAAAAIYVRSIAAVIRPHLSKGDVAFVLAPATAQVPLLYMALFSVGAVVCPSNPACTSSEISRQFRLVKPKIAFATSSTASLLPSPGPGSLDLVILLDSQQFPSFPVCRGNGGQVQLPLDLVEVRQSDPAVILFSSGTTGMPKAVLKSHRTYIALIAEFADYHRRGIFQNGDPFLLSVPMFHAIGLQFSLQAVALGKTTIVVDRPGLRGLLSFAERYGAASMTAAPPVVVWMTETAEKEHPDSAELNLRALREIICGGSVLPPLAAERFRRSFPSVEIRQGYGMTESGGISMMIATDDSLNYRSVGRLNSSVKARIVDPETDKPLGVGMLGELRVKSLSVMTEYLGDAEATNFVFDSEGWLKTGDQCYFDEEGYIYLVSRIKELIKYKGYQVPPTELEQLLVLHEEIVDAAVVPYPDEFAGEIPMAYVVRRPGSTITESQIMDFVSKQVAPYKKIRKVKFIDSIPKNPSGKILRKKLVPHLRSTGMAKL